MATCVKCGAKAALFSNMCTACLHVAATENSGRLDQQAVRAETRRAEIEEEKRRLKEKARQISTIKLSTTPGIEGMRIVQTLDIVTAECVFGMNLFRDVFASISDVFGGRSEASQKVLRDARKTCLRELRQEAFLCGANAVIGVDLDYSEFSGGGKSMLFLVASGTAVKVEPVLHNMQQT